jgi:threonyl-tRNA synthetase
MYSDLMFTTQAEKRDYAVKPMNCPCHIQIFNQGLKSYRDLPLRMAEFGSCHRNEPSGSLHGIMRVRNFVQDDAHIFCAEEQVQAESAEFIRLLQKVYADFGFTDVQVKLSTRPEKRVGTDEQWDAAEAALAAALDAQRLAYELQPGEGAFYGPKIEFSLKDCLDRVWQCGTLQLDFNLPVRLGAEYVAEDNAKKYPVMLHRAILGSLERFIGILIEHHAGAMPLWLAPVQSVVMNISEGQAEYAAGVAKALRQAGFRVEADLRNEKINYKIREHSVHKLPYQIVVGEKEKAVGMVAVRVRGGQDLGQMSLDSLIERWRREVEAKAGPI